MKTVLELVDALRTVLKSRIDSGSLSVEILAKHSSLGKSHIYRFLQAKATISVKAMHRIMQCEKLDVEFLVKHGSKSPPRTEITQFIPVVAHRSALLEASFSASAIEKWLPVSLETLDQFEHRRVRSRDSWRRFVAVRLDHEEASTMDRLANEGAVLVIDRHYGTIRPSHSEQQSLFGALMGRELVLGYGDAIGTNLVIHPPTAGMRPRVIYLEPNTDPGKYIVGRIVMILNVFL